MTPSKSFNSLFSLNSLSYKILLLAILFGIITINLHFVNVIADDDDDEDDDHEDFSQDLGWVSVGLFAFSSLYIFLYQFFRITKQFSEEGNLATLKTKYRSFFVKIRKPFLYIHYLAGFLALVTLLIHGIFLTRGDDASIILGWVTGGIYVFYILTGVVLWLKIKPFWVHKKLRKTLLYIHRSMLLFAIAIIVHIIHLAVSD